jgi:hypothetical protein
MWWAVSNGWNPVPLMFDKTKTYQTNSTCYYWNCLVFYSPRYIFKLPLGLKYNKSLHYLFLFNTIFISHPVSYSVLPIIKSHVSLFMMLSHQQSSISPMPWYTWNTPNQSINQSINQSYTDIEPWHNIYKKSMSFLYLIKILSFTSKKHFWPKTKYMHTFILLSNKCGHRNVLSKRQVWMSIFHIINFKKKKIMDTGVLDFFNKKLILDYYFCLKSDPVFLFQIFIIAIQGI